MPGPSAHPQRDQAEPREPSPDLPGIPRTDPVDDLYDLRPVGQPVVDLHRHHRVGASFQSHTGMPSSMQPPWIGQLHPDAAAAAQVPDRRLEVRIAGQDARRPNHEVERPPEVQSLDQAQVQVDPGGSATQMLEHARMGVDADKLDPRVL